MASCLLCYLPLRDLLSIFWINYISLSSSWNRSFAWFRARILSGQEYNPSTMTGPSTDDLINLYRAMVTARRVDEMERQATNQGLANFHVSGMGHEASAALAPFLTEDDWLHCHYRDKALMLARGFTP